MNRKNRNDRNTSNRGNNPPRPNNEDRWFDDGGRNYSDQPQPYERQHNGGDFAGRSNEESAYSWGTPSPQSQTGGYGYSQFGNTGRRELGWQGEQARSGSNFGRGYQERRYPTQGQFGQSCPNCGHAQHGNMGSGANAGQNYDYGNTGDYGVGQGYNQGQQLNPGPFGQNQPSVSRYYPKQGQYSAQQGGTGSYNWGGAEAGFAYGNMGSQQHEGTFESPRGGSQSSAYGRGSPPSEMSDWRSSEENRTRKFAGRGPKGYKRSDDRIREDVSDALSEGYLDASDISVSVQNGEVTLSGTVDSRQVKFLAENMAEGVIGVTDVNNQLRVMREMPSSTTRQQESDRDSRSESQGNQSSQKNAGAKPLSTSSSR